jgi:NodT family efflux transporter outer membrane factor (OMF) lipoprotein
MAGMRLSRILAALLTGTFLSGCAVGPDFVWPNPPDVAGYTKEPLALNISGGGNSQRFVPAADVPAQWWALYRSPGLNALIARALKANPSLDSAMASLRAAKEIAIAQQGKYFPLLEANPTANRQLIAQSLSSPLSSGANLLSLYTAQLAITYTPDVWGLNRRNVESLDALANVQRFQLEAAYVTLASNLVAAAIQEAALRGQIKATQRLIVINSEILDLMRKQLAAGFENDVDVATQEAQLAQQRASLPPLQKQLAQQRDLIAALAGRFPNQQPPETFDLDSFRLPHDLPLTLPSSLVAQRPDVRAAEEQLHSASALVGVAIANMLPQFTLTANGGYTSQAIANLLSPQNGFWSLTAGATQPLFDGFTLLHEKRAAEDVYDQAAATYRLTVISALQNVADSLRALQADAHALRAAIEWERATKRSFDLTRQQMQNGFTNFILLLSKPTSKPCSIWSKCGPTSSPIRRPCSRPSVAAGGTAKMIRRVPF